MTREEAIEYLKRADVTVGREIKTKTAEALEMAIKALEQEPRKGHWITNGNGDGFKKWHCSICNSLVRNSQKPWYKYCPNCGAKMIEPQESEDKE